MIGVTGVTGAVGGQVASLLDRQGARFVMLARSPNRAPKLAAQVRCCSYGDPESTFDALVGIETLFMVSASESPSRVDEHRTFIDAATKAGVEHIVYTSFAGAAPDAVFTSPVIITPLRSICAPQYRHTRSSVTTSISTSSYRCRTVTE